jgi:hypothetical protein
LHLGFASSHGSSVVVVASIVLAPVVVVISPVVVVIPPVVVVISDEVVLCGVMVDTVVSEVVLGADMVDPADIVVTMGVVEPRVTQRPHVSLQSFLRLGSFTQKAANEAQFALRSSQGSSVVVVGGAVDGGVVVVGQNPHVSLQSRAIKGKLLQCTANAAQSPLTSSQPSSVVVLGPLVVDTLVVDIGVVVLGPLVVIIGVVVVVITGVVVVMGAVEDCVVTVVGQASHVTGQSVAMLGILSQKVASEAQDAL